MTTVEKPNSSIQAQPGWTSFVGKWAQKGVCGAAGTVGGYIGQEAGRGYVVRVGSTLIYDAVYAKAAATSSWVLANVTAPLAANASVGVAVPYLSWAGAIGGGAAGFGLGYLASLAALKVSSFIINGALSLVRPTKPIPSQVQANVTTKPKEEPKVAVEGEADKATPSPVLITKDDTFLPMPPKSADAAVNADALIALLESKGLSAEAANLRKLIESQDLKIDKNSPFRPIAIASLQDPKKVVHEV